MDGRAVGSARQQLEWTGQYVDLGAVRLGSGRHTLHVRSSSGGWQPGTHGGAPFPVGPAVVAPVDSRRVVSVAPARAQSLCGRRLDWVEAVG